MKITKVRILSEGQCYARHVKVRLDILLEAAEDAMESSHYIVREMAFEILCMSLNGVLDELFSLFWERNESVILWSKLLMDLECYVVMKDDMLI